MRFGECQSRPRMCECFARLCGVSWSPAASYEGLPTHCLRLPFLLGGPSAPPRAGRPSPSRPPGPGQVGRPRPGGPAGAAPFLPAAPRPRVPSRGRPDWRSFGQPSGGSPGRAGIGAAAEGRPPESHAFRTRHQAALAELKGNAQAVQLQALSGTHPPAAPGEAGDADRAAQKEKLHAELKRVLQKKGESQRSVQEEEEAPLASAEMEAQLQAMEKTIETSELLEIVVETEAQAGVSGMSVAGGGRGGLFVRDVLKDSPAAKALRLQEGDQLLSARVFFDDVKYEDALQILKSVEPYKVSFWLKRTVPGMDVSRKPGTSTFKVKGPKAKMAKLNIRSLTPLKKKRMKRKVAKGPREGQVPGGAELELPPLDVEFSLPKFSRLRKAKSTGEVAVAEPSPDLTPRASSLETKRRRLKFPRLKVKDVAAAAAARSEGRLEVGLPKADMGSKTAGRGEAEGKAARFTVPFRKKPKEGAGAKVGVGFQAPQVEVDLPLPKARPGGDSVKSEDFRVQMPLSGLPKVEVALPTVGAGELGGPESAPQAGLKLPTAEVVAPKVDVDLSLPKWEAAAPEGSLKGEGFRIQVPMFGVSAGEKLPAVEVALGKGRGAADGLEEPPRLGVALPALEVEAPSVNLELPLPKGKADSQLPKPRVELPEVSVKVPSLGLPKLGAKRPEEVEGKLPQLELSVGKPEGPKAKAPSIPGLGFSLLERKLESKAAPGEVALPAGVKVPALDLSIPRVAELQMPKTGVELGGTKVEMAAEGPGFKLHVPQVSLPTFDISARTTPPPPPPPPPPTKEPKPRGDVCVSVDVPRLDLSLPGVPAMQLPKAHLPRPELALAVETPAVEVAVPSPRLSFPSAAMPTLDLEVPRVGVELGLPKTEGRGDVEKKMPTLETLGKQLDLEISVPPCGVAQPELETSRGVFEGPDVSGVVAKIPKVGLALGKELPGEAGVEGRPLPKVGLEMESPAIGAKLKLPSVEIPAAKCPDVTRGADKPLEAEVKLKSPKFALPKFSISGPKIRKASPESEAPEMADRGAKLKMPKFGISFPKARRGAEAEGRGDAALSEGGLKFPSVGLPAVGIALPEGRAELSAEEGSGIDLPEVDLKMPKVSLPKFGGRGREEDQEPQPREAQRRGSKEGLAVELAITAPKKEAAAKMPKFKMPSFGITRRDVGEMPSLDVSAKSKKPLSPPKAGAEKGRLHIQTPELPGKVPQVELPKFSSRGAEAGPAAGGTESPGLQVKVPQLDIAVPGLRADGDLTLERPGVGIAETGIRGQEGEPRMPCIPSLGVSAPQVELDIGLPTAGPEISAPQGAVGADAKIRLPKVELPTFGKGEEGGSEAEVHLLGGRRLSFGREGMTEGGAEGSLLGAKIRVPKVDLSLPKARLSDVELPLTRGEAEVEGPEGKFKMPSVGLPKFSPPRVKGPELELDVSLEAGVGKVSGPAIRLPKFGGSSSDGEGEADRDLPRLPQLELKAPKLRGSHEGLGRGEAEAAMGPEDGKFKLKMPSLSLSKAGPESGLDTQPLCPSAEGPDFAFKMPQLALPDVGFSVEQAGKKEAKGDPGGGDLQLELGGIEAVMKVPKIKMPTFGGLGPKGDADTSPGRRGSGGADLEGTRGAFRVPGVELSAPSFTAQAEYDVEGAQLQHSSSRALEATGQKSPGGKAGSSDEGRKYQVKLPKFGLALPRAGPEAGDGGLGQETEAKGKRSAFLLARPKGRSAEGSSGLLEGDEEGGGKGVMAKLKLRPSFGLSLSKPKTGAEVNGELEEGGPSRIKVPKLGFSNAEGASHPNGERAEEASALQNGAQDSKAKLGKIRLPQVELSSPAVGSETDPELNLNLVRAEEAKEGVLGKAGPFSPLKAPKFRVPVFRVPAFRAPKISLSGPKNRNGESADSGDAGALGEKPPGSDSPDWC